MMEEDKSKEVLVFSTKSQIEDVKESLFWKDIERELVAWQKGFEIERSNIVKEAAEENHSTANILMHMGSIDGRIKAINYLLNLPDIFLQILEDQKNDSER
jgi:hypothetical protein